MVTSQKGLLNLRWFWGKTLAGDCPAHANASGLRVQYRRPTAVKSCCAV